GDWSDDDVAVADVVVRSVDRNALGRRLAVDRTELFVEQVVHFGKRDFVLGTLGASERGNDAGKIELQRVGEHRLRRTGFEPEALLLGVSFDERDLALVAARQAQVIERLVVYAEEAARRSVLGRHV